MSSALQKIPFVIACEGYRLSYLRLQMAGKAGSQIPKLEDTFLKSNLGETIWIQASPSGFLGETSK